VGQFVFVRKVVTRFASEGLFQRTTQPLRKMLGRRRDREPSFLILFLIHYSDDRIVFSGAVGFVLQQPLDLIAMLHQFRPQ
jgi:hypothetical protein